MSPTATDWEQESLSDYLRRMAFAKGLSISAVARRSERGDQPGISRSYLAQLQNDQAGNPSIEKLSAIARGLGVPVEEILHVALRQARPPRRLQLIVESWARLSPAQRTHLEPLIVTLEREIKRCLEG